MTDASEVRWISDEEYVERAIKVLETRSTEEAMHWLSERTHVRDNVLAELFRYLSKRMKDEAEAKAKVRPRFDFSTQVEVIDETLVRDLAYASYLKRQKISLPARTLQDCVWEVLDDAFKVAHLGLIKVDGCAVSPSNEG